MNLQSSIHDRKHVDKFDRNGELLFGARPNPTFVKSKLIRDLYHNNINTDVNYALLLYYGQYYHGTVLRNRLLTDAFWRVSFIVLRHFYSRLHSVCCSHPFCEGELQNKPYCAAWKLSNAAVLLGSRRIHNMLLYVQCKRTRGNWYNFYINAHSVTRHHVAVLELEWCLFGNGFKTVEKN